MSYPNPVGSRKRRRVHIRSYGKVKPLKTEILTSIIYQIGTGRTISDIKKVRKALQDILDDTKMSELLEQTNKTAKALVKLGIEHGY